MATDSPTFGLWYDFRQRPPLGDYARLYAECLEEIEEAEGLGYEGVWLSEHHFVDDGYLPSPLAVAAALAARTKRMTIGTNVLLLPMHHPLRVAEDAAVAHLVSGGRFILGVGQGYVQHEFEVLGFNRRYRPSLFEEGVEIIRRAWEDGRIGYEGKRWRFEDLPFGPRLERRPLIYIGASADPAIDRAARMADGFLTSAAWGAGNILTYRKLREALARHGRANADFPYVASGVVYVREDSERARSEVAPAIAYQRSRYAEWGTDRGRPKPEPCRGRGTSSATPRRSQRASRGFTQRRPTTTSASGLVCRASPTSRHSRVCACSPLRWFPGSATRWEGVKPVPEVWANDV